jgi:AraC-like DNA-binding protein
VPDQDQQMLKHDDCFFHYLPTCDDSLCTTVNVVGAGRFISQPGDAYPPACHPMLYQFDWRRGRILPEFQVLLLTDGAGEFESETTGLLQLEHSVLMILFPGIWHRYRPLPERGWTERWLSFSGELAYRLFDFRVPASPIMLTTPTDTALLIKNFDELLISLNNSPAANPMLLAMRALRVIVESATLRLRDSRICPSVAEVRSNYANVEDTIVREALDIIWSRSHCLMSVSDIARQLPISRRTLDQRFTSAMGYSVLEEINKCRMVRAKRLMKTTNLPVKTVAHLAGFPSTERMRVSFVEQEHLSPLAFRRKHSLAQKNPSLPR